MINRYYKCYLKKINKVYLINKTPIAKKIN